MHPDIPNGICKFHEPSGRFNKDLRKLPLNIQKQYRNVIAELLSGQLPKSRSLERYKAIDNQFTVRLNLSYRFRFVYYPDDNTAKPVAIGTHENVY